MSGFDLIVKQEAQLEIRAAYIYYERQQNGLGERFLNSLESCMNRIRIYPEHFPVKKVPYHEALIKKFPYLIVFEKIAATIVIYSVFNTWQNPKKKP